MNIHKACILLCSWGTRHPPLTSLMASTCGPRNAFSLFPGTSSAAAHRPRSLKNRNQKNPPKNKKTSLSVSAKFFTAKYYCIYLKILFNGLWEFLKQTFKKKIKLLLLRNIPYKSVFRHINTTQKSSLSETSRMLVSKDVESRWKAAKHQKQICPLSSSSILPAYDVNLKQQKQAQGHWLKHWNLLFLQPSQKKKKFWVTFTFLYNSTLERIEKFSLHCLKKRTAYLDLPYSTILPLAKADINFWRKVVDKGDCSLH